MSTAVKTPNKKTLGAALNGVVFSSSFFAPFRGIQFFMNDSQLWPVFLAVCIPSMLLSMVILAILSVLVFVPYSFVMTMATGPFGFISALVTLLSVTRSLTIFFSQILFIRNIQSMIFDEVLKKEGAAEVVARYLATRRLQEPPKNIESRLYYQTLPFLGRELLYVVLGIIPIIGPFLVMVCKAPIKGYKADKRYYKLMMWNYAQVNRFFREYHPDYMAFGLVALALEMVPGLTIFFMFTNNIGMALWTAKFHKDFEKFMSESDPETTAEQVREMEFWNNVVHS